MFLLCLCGKETINPQKVTAMKNIAELTIGISVIRKIKIRVSHHMVF